MRIKTLNSLWIHEAGYRLDSNPYMSGAIEAKVTIEAANLEKADLVELTHGGSDGLINPGRIKRIWAKSSDHGRKFLSSTDILKSNQSYIRAISEKAVRDNPKLIIHQGDILITRAGTIGRMAFTREDMHEFACSEDVLRVIPDLEKIPGGYLYAYLRSKFGVPLILSSTYGAIIQHIEPHHLKDLPVPRLPKNIEAKIDELVLKASSYRTKANRLIEYSRKEICELIKVNEKRDNNDGLKVNSVPMSEVKSARRFDVLYFSRDAQKIIENIRESDHRRLNEIATVVKPGMFKRIMSTPENNGIPFYTGSELFLTELNPKYFVSKKTQHIQQCVLDEYWILLQAFGQRGGLIARAMMTTKRLKNSSATDLQIQIKLKSKFDAGFVLAFIDSKPGYSTVIRTPIGGSIPHINPKDVEDILVPWPNKTIRERIGKKVVEAWELRDSAQTFEEKAIKMVEDAIEYAAPKH